MRLLRTIAFYLFLVVFLVSCPLIVLYALGYVFQPGAERGIVKTGLIHLSSVPPGASVYVGKRRYTKQTPTSLSDLFPGDYPISVAIKNHRPWVGMVPVEAEKATALDHLLLLPQQWNWEVRSGGAFEELTPIPGSRVFLLRYGPRLDDHVVYDGKEDSYRPLSSLGSPSGARVLSCLTARGSPSVLLRIESSKGERWLWVEFRGEDMRAEDLTSLFPRRPLRVEWDPVEKRQLFTFQDGSLNRLDVASRAIYPRMVEHVRGYGLFEKSIYVLRDDHVFLRIDHEGGHGDVLVDDPLLSRRLEGLRGFVDIRVFSKDTILFLGEKGEVLTAQPPYDLVERGVLGLEWDPQRERVLLWQKERLGILETARGVTKGDSAAPAPRVQWVFTEGNAIQQAFWVYEGSHLLFRDGDRVFLLELEPYGASRLHELLQVQRNSAVLYSEESGTLYFLERAAGKLCSMEILPKRELLALPFP